MLFFIGKRCFLLYFCGFWGGFLDRVYFLLKKELICYRVLGIFADLLLLCRTGSSLGNQDIREPGHRLSGNQVIRTHSILITWYPDNLIYTGVNSITAWLTQASDGAKAGPRVCYRRWAWGFPWQVISAQGTKTLVLLCSFALVYRYYPMV